MQKILVINNDIDTMNMLQLLLERKTGMYKVEFTSDRDAVLEIIEQFKPDLLLIDVLQKEVFPLLEGHPQAAKLPVILMTGYSVRDTAVEFKVNDIIEKPFVWEILENKVMRQFEQMNQVKI